MGRKRKNTFSKALGHLKSSKITEAAPVNSTTGVYSITPGTLTRVEPGPDVPDYSTIDWDVDGGDGKDTSGLFDGNGDSKFIAPPGDNSYILGPMAAMYYTWAYPWTMIGYIRESDRRMVNLGRIDGKLGDWDGSAGNASSGSGTFSSYGQLTTEQALWFRDTNKKDNAGNDPANANYRAFYPGPPSNSPDAFGRYYCTITGTPLAQKSTDKTVAPIDLQATDILSAILDRQSKGISLSKAEKDYLKKNQNNPLWDFAKEWTEDGGLQGLGIGLFNRGTKVLGDFLLGQAHRSPWMVKGLNGTTFDTFNFNKDAFTSFKGSGPKPNVGNWFQRQAGKLFKGRKLADFADDVVKGVFNPNLNFDPKFFQKLAGKNYVGQYFTDGTQFTQALDYAKDGVVVATERLNSAAGWKNWFGGQFSRSVKGEPEIFVRGTDLAKNKVFKVFDAADPKSVAKLKDLVTTGAKNSKWLGRAGRAVPFVGAVASGYDAYDRFQKGDTFGGVLSVASMMPGPVGWWALGAQVAYDVEGAVNKDGFKSSVKSTDDGLKKAARFVRGEEYIMEGVNSDTQVIPDIGKQGMYDGLLEKGVPLNNPEAYAQQMAAVMIESGMNPELIHIIISAVRRKDFSPEDVEGIKASMMGLSMNLVAHRRKMEAGQDGKEFHPNNPLSTEDDPWALSKQQTQEGVQLSESRKNSIIKNLKQPTVLPETKQKSYKVNPGRRLKTNFQGMDKLVNDITTQEPFKRKADVWSKDWQGYNSRLSQDKKNMVLELIGDGKHYFDYMLSDSKIKNAEEMEKFWGLHPEMHSYFYNGKKHKAIRKEEVKGDMIVFMEDENGVKSTVLQSELNLILEAEHEKEMLDEYNKLEPTPFFKDPLMKKVAKRLKNEIEYEGKPAVKGYPDEPPPKMVKGFHPKLGKTYKYDKLDPVSAVMMRQAPTGDQVIDANVEKAAKKPKVKVKEERSNWRKDLEVFKEQMTTSGVFSYTLDASNDDIHTNQSGFDGESITAVTNFTDIALVNDPHDMGTNIRNNQDPNLVPTNSDANHTAYTTSSGLEGDSGGFRGIDWSSTSTVTNENQPVDTNIVTGSDGPYMGNEVGAHLAWGSPGNPGYPRFAALKAVDTTEVDTISINWFTRGLVVSDGEGGYVARDDTDFTEAGDGIYLFYWGGDKEGAAQYAGDLNASTKDHDGWRPVNVKPDGTTDSNYSPLLIPHKAEGYKGNRFFKNDLTLPPWTRDKNTRFILVQIDNHTGVSKSRWGMTSVRFRRQFPMSITPLLDDPQASSFIRVGSSPQERVTSPTKRRKKVDKILKSSKKYVNKVVSDPFPGTESVVGEAQGTSKDPYIAQQWNDKKQEFADVGTLDQQKDKFVSKDVKLPPNYFDIQKKFKK